MRCVYCELNLVGHSEVTRIPGQGLAHYNCFITAQFQSRRFRGLDIAALSDGCLEQLKELVVTEMNERNRDEAGLDIELF